MSKNELAAVTKGNNLIYNEMRAACPQLNKQMLAIISNIVANIENAHFKSENEQEFSKHITSKAKNYAANLANYLQEKKQINDEDWFELALAAVTDLKKEVKEEVIIEINQACLEFIAEEVEKKIEKKNNKIKEIIKRKIIITTGNKIDSKELTKLLINIEQIADNIKKELELDKEKATKKERTKPARVSILRSGIGILASIFAKLESMIFGELIEKLAALKNQFLFKEKDTSKSKTLAKRKLFTSKEIHKDQGHTISEVVPSKDLQDAVKLLVSAGLIAPTDKKSIANDKERETAKHAAELENSKENKKVRSI